MRKVKPQDVRDAFCEQVDSSLDHYQRVLTALRGTGSEKLDISLQSRTLIHSVFVDFECFISDLFISYLNRSFHTYQNAFETSVRSSAAQKHSLWMSGRITFNRPPHMSLTDLEQAIDPDGWNLTFKSCAVMKEKAAAWLDPQHANRIVHMQGEDERLVDTMRGVRNWIAHQSIGAGKRMNDLLANIEQGPGTPNHELGRGVRKVTNIGAFLKSKIGAERRVEVYCRRLKDVAANITLPL
ncbi:hypothetical protein [Pseudomonas sp. USHLN015]|uniref:hypothetical protein n=1 Tax=Pseudomonas sp. USHLN015 TaxID=3081296 RepID=UPI00301CF5AC